MIDYPTARKIVYDYLTLTFPVDFPEITIVEERTREKNYGWVIFFYNPQWDGELGFGGLGLLIVMKEDGKLYDLVRTYVAMLTGAEEIVEAFEARRVDPHLWLEEDRDTNLGIQLALAAEEEDLATVQRLCEQGVSADSLGPNGRSALMHATQRQNIPIVRTLLRHGADVNLPWPSGITPLAISLWNEGKNYSLVKILLRAGADVHLRSDDGWTALHWAAYSGSPVSILRLLIRAGADVNAVNEEGISPLMFAAQQSVRYHGQRRGRYLLWKGADVSLTDFYGRTALDHALEHEGPVKLLLRAGAIRGQRDAAKEGYMIYSAFKRRDSFLLVKLLDGGNYGNTRYQGATALMWAVRNGQGFYVTILLERGAEVDAIDDHQNTALMWAARWGRQMSDSRDNLSVLRLLLEVGADVNRRGEKGWTPLHFAVHSADLEGLEALLEAKADVHATDDNGISALMLAIEQDDPSIIARLKSETARYYRRGGTEMFPAESKLAPPFLLVRYLAVFQRFFAVVIDYTQAGDKAGMLLAGYLANALHNVPRMLWHCDPQDWLSPTDMGVWMAEFSQGLAERDAPQHLIVDSKRILSAVGTAQEFQLRDDLVDMDLAPLPKMCVYLDWLYSAFLYIRSFRNYGSYQLSSWRDLEKTWSDNAEAAERMANFCAVIASVLLPVPRALVQWKQFDEASFLDQVIRAAERLPAEDREAWIQYTNEKARQLRLLPAEQIQSEGAL